MIAKPFVLIVSSSIITITMFGVTVSVVIIVVSCVWSAIMKASHIPVMKLTDYIALGEEENNPINIPVIDTLI